MYVWAGDTDGNIKDQVANPAVVGNLLADTFCGILKSNDWWCCCHLDILLTTGLKAGSWIVCH